MRRHALLTVLALITAAALVVGCSAVGGVSPSPSRPSATISGAAVSEPATSSAAASGSPASGSPGASEECVREGDPQVGPPAATPLADPPDAHAGDGTQATLDTEEGDIVVELFTESSPVAAENFANLARAGFYDCVIFHRVIPDFVIQGGDPEGTGRGGPDYTIADDAVVGEYERGFLAMARPGGQGGTVIPNSQGSQFFIILADLRERLPREGSYALFGRVLEGMDVVDAIAAGATTGDPENRPLDPVTIRTVTVHGP